ncbi:hypothetical protein K438DRAFT_1759237 [Mycena galopus ATCC 62051]|nr:hypothetical protein K438DRAFT_1759237 [Mycena galopus ATCC 62051]
MAISGMYRCDAESGSVKIIPVGAVPAFHTASSYHLEESHCCLYAFEREGSSASTQFKRIPSPPQRVCGELADGPWHNFPRRLVTRCVAPNRNSGGACSSCVVNADQGYLTATRSSPAFGPSKYYHTTLNQVRATFVTSANFAKVSHPILTFPSHRDTVKHAA